MSKDKESRATQSVIDKLHRKTAEGFLRLMEAYERGEFVNGEGEVKPVPASLLAASAKFLQTQGADRPEPNPIPEGEDDQRVKELPVFDDE